MQSIVGWACASNSWLNASNSWLNAADNARKLLLLEVLCPVLVDWPVSRFSAEVLPLLDAICLVLAVWPTSLRSAISIIKGVTVYNSSSMLSQCLACSRCRANLSSLCSGVSRAPAFARRTLAWLSVCSWSLCLVLSCLNVCWRNQIRRRSECVHVYWQRSSKLHADGRHREKLATWQR